MRETCQKLSNLAITYIDDLFSVNNDNFWKIYPWNLFVGAGTRGYYPQFKRGVLSGHKNRSWRQQGTFSHRRVRQKRRLQLLDCFNFPFMDSNIPANPAHGVYMSQLVKCARICTAKVDFMRRLRSLSSCLQQQGFKSTSNRLTNSSLIRLIAELRWSEGPPSGAPYSYRKGNPWYWTSMLWSIDPSQNKVSADQYHVTIWLA